MQVDLRITLLSPDGAVANEIHAPHSLYGAYGLAATSKTGGEYRIEISNDGAPSARGAYELRLIELRPLTAEDPRRLEEEQLLNHALDNADPAPGQSAAEAARACSTINDPFCRARSTFVVALLYLHANRYPDADREMARAIESDTNDDYVKGAILNQWLLVKTKLGDLGAATSLARQAIAYSEKARSPNLQAISYSRKAVLTVFADPTQDIESDLTRTIDLADTAGLDEIAAETRIRLAEILILHGDPRAEQLAKAAANTARQFGLKAAEAFALTTLCTIRWRLGDVQGAIDYASQAMAIYATGFDPGGQIDNYESIAGLYSNLGDLNKTGAYLQSALDIARSVHDKDREARVLIDYGNLKRLSGDLDGALALYRQSLDLTRTIPNKGTEAWALESMGTLLVKKKEYDAAERNYSEALAIHKAMRDSFKQAELLDLFAALARSRGDESTALDYYQRALELRRSIGDKRGTATSELMIARALRSQGKRDEARAILAGVLDDIEDQRQRIAAPNLRMGYFGALQPFYEEYIDLLMDLHDSASASGFARTAFQVSEFARARVLMDSLPEIPDGIPADLVPRERELRRKILNLSGTGRQSSKQALDLALADYELLYNDIRARNPRYAAQKSPPILTANEVSRKLLDDRTVLLEYKICPERSYAWVVTTGSVYVAELPGREKLQDLVARFSRARANDTVDADEMYWGAARDLSEAILAPVADKLQAGRLLLAADDALQQVSFAGLPWPSNPNGKPAPLIEHFTEIVNIPSASALAAFRSLPREQSASKQIAIFADPVFGPARPRLIGAGVEARKIANMASPGEASVFTGTGANVNAVEKAHLENYRNVLFATHAIVNTERPDISGIVLSEVDASGRPRNGMLSLLDIYGLRLRADLVTLSTCESAAGKTVQGEGVVALSRGFLYAGARAVVATLWPIDDARAAPLVEGVYSRLLSTAKPSPAAALRDVQLARWRGGQSPRHWAAFVIIGDPDIF